MKRSSTPIGLSPLMASPILSTYSHQDRIFLDRRTCLGSRRQFSSSSFHYSPLAFIRLICRASLQHLPSCVYQGPSVPSYPSRLSRVWATVATTPNNASTFPYLPSCSSFSTRSKLLTPYSLANSISYWSVTNPRWFRSSESGKSSRRYASGCEVPRSC